VLGIKVTKKIKLKIPENLGRLVEERDKARTEKDFGKSDEIRKEIESFGFDVMDTPDGTKVQKK